MALASGSRLGSYEVIAQVGAGGMGEVYRARDTKLNRDVALKILPEAFAIDGDRIARFRREAQVLASLNHPNIAAIHGFEDSGSTHALVLELVEGPTLADRIAKGPIPIDEALPIAKQIAEALEAAHEQGIIHRDLKPANIKVRDDGTVKVLDFGLAKAMEPASAISPMLTASPTITTPAQMTGVGTLLGTAAYMSPEQAKGRPADKRSDMWAFGCVFYEMLTGTRAFEGDDVSDTLAAILRGEPNWKLLPPLTPVAVLRVLHRCLTKDARWRVQHIGDVRVELGASSSDAADIVATGHALSQSRRRRSSAIALLAIGAAAGVAVTWALVRTATAPALVRTTRFTITPPESPRFRDQVRSMLAISPDGRQVVYAANGRLYLRRLNELVDTPIRGTEENPNSPAFSPDGHWIAYFTGNSLKKIATTGGVAIALCEAVSATDLSWADNRLIFVFDPIAKTPGIYAVADSGGTPQPIVEGTASDRISQPQMLADGESVLFTIQPNTRARVPDDAEIVVQSLRTHTRRTLVHGGYNGRLLPTGHLLYVRNGTAVAQLADATTLRLSGGPVEVVDDVRPAQGLGSAQLAVAASGTLVYVSGSPEGQGIPVWVDRMGHEEPLAVSPGSYVYPVLSPDGTQVALNTSDRTFSILIWNFARATLTRLTADEEDARYPVWTHDGKRIIYSAGPGQGVNAQRRLTWRSADGTGVPEALTDGANQYPSAISPDDRFVVFRRGNPVETDLFVVSLTGDRKMAPLIQRPLAQMNPDISPDGHWIAYQSNEATPDGVASPNNQANFQIYVQPFPNVADGRWLVSTHGGTRPRWSRSGQELFYLTADGTHIEVVRVTSGRTFTFERAADLLDVQRFEHPPDAGRWYDVSVDGQRFLLLKSTANVEKPELVVVENWFEELKQRVPVK